MITRFLIGVGFNAFVVFIAFHFFGVSARSSWFTFFAFVGFACLIEIGRQLDSIDRKLDELLQGEASRT